MHPTTPPPRTAFPATERMLRSALGGARLDTASFARRLAPRRLARCGGTCCAEGATLNPEEALVLTQLSKRNRERLRSLAPNLPDPRSCARTECTAPPAPPAPSRERVVDYPEHFPETSCGFLLADGRCALRCLAEEEGRHPWTYKPPACWLHPISLSGGGIELVDEHADPHPRGFASQTHCGRTAPCGTAAHEVLASELEFLGAILERDLLAELRETDPA